MADQDVSSMINFDLEDMFSYSLTPTIVAVIVVLILLLIYYYLFLKKTKQQFVIPHFVGKDAIKRTYLSRLDDIIKDYHSQKVDNRGVYIRLSKLIRGFAFEMTGVKLKNCTLDDISRMNMPQLYNLVYEYYDPEFARVSRGHSPMVIDNVLTKTRMVIERWT